MIRRWLCVAVTAAVAAVLGGATLPVPARAAGGWNWPVAGDVALPYGARYTGANGTSCTHGGLDIEAPAGATVRACAPGEVAFSGLVPAGEGARAWAVTILTSEGLRVTYLPLTAATVRRGQTISESHEIGTLVGWGDASGGAAHLHLGVKRGGTSLDPLAFLGDPADPAAPVASAPPASPSSHVRAGVGPAASYAPASAPAATVARGGAQAPAGAASPAGARVSGVTPASALGDALRTLAQARPLARVELVASAPVLDVERAGADLVAARDSAIAIAVRVGLLLLAAACAWPVLKAARTAGARMAPEPARRGRR